MAALSLPLAGIRIIDMTVVWAGPFATVLLGDMGAEIVRIDSLQHHDVNTRGNPNITSEQVRSQGGGVFPNGDPGADPWNRSASFNTTGRNKKSITIDLTRPEGMAVFFRLVERSDVFIENNAPDVVNRLGLGWDVLKRVNPRLVMISMPAFGGTGPYHHFRAYGANMEAVVGHTLLRGYPDTDPTNTTNVFFADATGGAAAAFAVVTALYQRDRTGEGQFIDMSLAENVGHTFSQAMMDYSMNGRVQTTLGNRDPSRAPQGVYPCAGDDSWLAISCRDDAEFAALCSVMGRLDLAADPRFAGTLARYHHQDELDAAIAAWTAGQDHYTAFHLLQQAGVTAAPVLTIPEVAADPHLHARGMWQRVEHPATGAHAYLGPIAGHLSKTPLRIWAPAPLLGQDNEYLYREVLGYSEEEYRWFVDHDFAGDLYIDVRERRRAAEQAASVGTVDK